MNSLEQSVSAPMKDSHKTMLLYLPEFELRETWRVSKMLGRRGVVSFGLLGSRGPVVFLCVVGSGIGLVQHRPSQSPGHKCNHKNPYPIHSSAGGKFAGLATRGDERSHNSSSIW